jgi:branched-chain amino acid transport system substrate-binding protein
VPEHTTNVSSALTKIRPMKPDLILVSAHVEEGIAAVKQSKELGVSPSGFGETVAPPTPDFVKALGNNAEGVIGSTQWTADSTGQDKVFGTAKDYAQEYEQRFGEAAEYHSAEAAAACLALVLGVEKAGSTDPAKVRDAIAGLDTESFFGPIKFDPTGKNADKPMSAIQITDGKPVTIFPNDQAQADLKWPAG